MAGSRRGATLDELRAIYEGRLAELTRVARAIVGDATSAEDVVQEAFVRAVRQRASYDGRGSLNGWVWRIVVNVARDARTRGPQQIEVDRPDLSEVGKGAGGAIHHHRVGIPRIEQLADQIDVFVG